MSKIEFKEFVRKNPQFVDYVIAGKTSWQKLYEIYDLYGEESEVWNKYKVSQSSNQSNINLDNSNLSIPNSFKDLLNIVKGIDLNNVQKGLNSLDKAIEAFKDIIPKGTKEAVSTYEPRPTYKYFED